MTQWRTVAIVAALLANATPSAVTTWIFTAAALCALVVSRDDDALSRRLG